jgi:Uma2 family endonuclease
MSFRNSARRLPLPIRFPVPEERPVPRQGDWTYADYRRLPDDGRRYEVLRGELYVAPAPTWKHQRAVLKLSILMELFVAKHQRGVVCCSPLDVILPGELATPVQPDLIFIACGRKDITWDPRVEGVPDLIVEVLSPSSRRVDRRTKFEIYAKAGVPEYWMLDQAARTIEVYGLRNGRYGLLGKFGTGERACSEVLPGFEPAVDDVFAE